MRKIELFYNQSIVSIWEHAIQAMVNSKGYLKQFHSHKQLWNNINYNQTVSQIESL